MKRKIYITVSVAVLCAVCLLSSCTDGQGKVSDVEALEPSENISIVDVEQVKKIQTLDELFQIDDGFIYFGRETCATCIAISPILAEIVCDQEIEIYYFSTDYFREEVQISEEDLQTVFDTYKILSVPTVVKCQDGQVYDIFEPKFNEERSNIDDVKKETEQFFTNYLIAK